MKWVHLEAAVIAAELLTNNGSSPWPLVHAVLLIARLWWHQANSNNR